MISAAKDAKTKDKDVLPLTWTIKLNPDAQLPGIYFYHGDTGKIRRYEEAYNEYEITPEMLMVWSRIANLDIDVDLLKEQGDTTSVAKFNDERDKMQTLFNTIRDEVATRTA